MTRKIISRPHPRLPEGGSAYLRFAFIFFFAVGILLGLLFFYRNYVSNSLNDGKANLTKLETDFDLTLISELRRISESIKVGKILLDNHLKQSDIFVLLEENTVPQVFYNSFAYSHDQDSLVLMGEALNYSSVALQAGIFESLDAIEMSVFSNLTLRDTGRVAFTLTLNFK